MNKIHRVTMDRLEQLAFNSGAPMLLVGRSWRVQVNVTTYAAGA